MKKINDMTEGQFKNLLDEYFAPPLKRSKMSDDEIKNLAQRLNRKIDVPLVTETGEEKILIKVVIQIDRFLYDNLPNELYDLVRSSERGIDDGEAKRLIKRLAKLANDHIDIPYIPESAEYVAIRFIIGVIINAARKGWDLHRAKETLDIMNIPSVEEAGNLELESLLAPA